MSKLYFTILLLFISMIIEGQYDENLMFDNYKVSVETNPVRFLTEDHLGVIWAGTNKGLYSFDGYSAYPHFTIGEKSNSVINCGRFISETLLMLGSEFGVLLYNIKTDQYESFLPDFKHDVRSILKIDSEVWIGCFDGLFIYDIDTEEIIELKVGNGTNDKNRLVYTLLKDEGYVYLGSNNKLGRYSIKNKSYELIEPSGVSSNTLIHSLLKDKQQDCIWVGQGGSLLKFHITSGELTYVDEFNVVKSMSLDSNNNILMGTDNGLCIFNGQKKRFIVHDSREKKSLANNVVWCVFKDSSDNIWLGTDNGISLLPNHRSFNYIPIYNLTQTGKGNHFTTIFLDSYNNYWFGGSNGLIMCKGSIEYSSDLRWFKMGGSADYISHNHIRNIFEDKDKNLWVATDYGLNRFDRKTQTFHRSTIESKDEKLNSNWSYDLLEDDRNRLWVASYNGGIFVIDRKKLESNTYLSVADNCYTMSNGLLGNNVDFIVEDNLGRVWALIHNLGINIINTKTEEVSTFSIDSYTNGVKPNYLMKDVKGFIWLGYSNGIARIDPLSKEVENIHLKGIGNIDILEMVEVDDVIWVSTNDGIRIVDKEKITVHHLNYSKEVFSSMHYDEQRKKMILGGVDLIATSDIKEQNIIQPKKILISAINVNNKVLKDYEVPLSTRYIESISLAHHENNLTIEFTDLMFNEESKGSYSYKISNNQNWIALGWGDNKIKINELSSGKYNLQIGISGGGKSVEVIKEFTIVIRPPWYATNVAKFIYALLILLLALWIYYFNSSKNRMKYEQLEKEKTLEQAKLKISFFSDVAHEFKTPLSLIIAPLGGLIRGIKNEKNRTALEMIYQNAMKLNSLIHQAIDYYRDDSKVNIGLLLTKVELVEFSRSIFLSFKEGMKDRDIEFIFNTNIDSIYLNIDLVKIESVLNNLISNACKYTNKGDSVIFSIDYQDKSDKVEIKISDTGIGIPKQDQPYIFQRFYQSSNSLRHEGKGIGLFLAKNYTELHGGALNVISELNEGTTFILQLPLIKSELEDESVVQTLKDSKEEKQLILIVEDNAAIADFIYNTFISDYKCVIANNGKTGLKACTDLNPDLIIADIMMPVMNGLEMADKLKKNPLTESIPLVFLTAKDDHETELKSIELNIEAFIAKPFDAAILFSRVNQILKNRKLLKHKARIEQIATPSFDNRESQDERFLAKITKIIEDNIAEPNLNVNMLCELANVSSKQLYRKVKQLTGLTTIDYIKSIRMKKAAMYLSNKNFTIAEVMYMVGFSNHSYFSKCFQSKFGQTPRQFIEREDKI